MKAAQIRELTSEELTRQLEECRREAFNLRMQQQTGQLENTGRIRQVRRDIARLETEKTVRAGR
jgi:large subunit ribosomal protein L29